MANINIGSLVYSIKRKKLDVASKPVLKNWTDGMSGFGKEIWKSISIEKYLRSLRQEW